MNWALYTLFWFYLIFLHVGKGYVHSQGKKWTGDSAFGGDEAGVSHICRTALSEQLDSAPVSPSGRAGSSMSA